MRLTHRNYGLLCLLSLAVIPSTTPLQAAEPIKVGVIGLDNYQAVAFTHLFHRAKGGDDLAGLKVVCAVPQHSPDIKESVDSLPRWVEQFEKLEIDMVDSIDVLLKRVDAVLVRSDAGLPTNTWMISRCTPGSMRALWMCQEPPSPGE